MIELIRKAEAAELLAVSEETVERLIAAGKLPRYEISAKCIRLDRADVLAYRESRYRRARTLSGKPSGVKDLRRAARYETRPSGYVPGMKVVDPHA